MKSMSYFECFTSTVFTYAAVDHSTVAADHSKAAEGNPVGGRDRVAWGRGQAG